MPLTRSSIRHSAIGSLILISGLAVLLCFVLPGGAEAAPPAPAGAEKCAECHTEETEAWHDSPHAQTIDAEGDIHGATCEDCHGSYVADHPDEGLMQLTVDSSPCQKCHSRTYQEWEGTIHAKNGVQCIGCHLSHSQHFRVSDDRLCESCHRERLDTAHGQSGVSCIDCHLSSTNAHEVGYINSENSSAKIPEPSHDFTAVVSADCVNCHGHEVHQENLARVSNIQPAGTPGCQPELIAKLESAEQTNKSLMTITPASLGLGLGIGGMLGVIAMLVFGYICQGMKKQ